MFELKFTKKDVMRAVWSFLAGAVTYVALAQTDIIEGTVNYKALAVGAVMAGLISLKNLLLKDGTTLKGGASGGGWGPSCSPGSR
jgi:hypothetical protein